MGFLRSGSELTPRFAASPGRFVLRAKAQEMRHEQANNLRI